MKVIELETETPTLNDVIGLAKDELVVLRQPDGSVYAVSHVDNFDVEVELLKNNVEFMKLMRQLSQDNATVSLGDLRRELSL